MGGVVVRASRVGKSYRLGGHGGVAYLKPLRESLGSLVSPRTGLDSDSALWALKEVSFEVRTGEAVGIIGHNGAGKSTLLKIISRITEPTEGEVEIRGRVGS